MLIPATEAIDEPKTMEIQKAIEKQKSKEKNKKPKKLLIIDESDSEGDKL
jgi:hypothetical protein